MPRRSLSDVPPGRWQVRERGRRLEVIDTLTGKRAAGPVAAEPPLALPAPAGRLRLSPLRQTRFDGGGEMTTRPFYDSKAPRTIQLDAGSAAIVGRVQLGLVIAVMLVVILGFAWPWLFAAPFLALLAPVREGARRRITAWLDVVEREGR